MMAVNSSAKNIYFNITIIGKNDTYMYVNNSTSSNYCTSYMDVAAQHVAGAVVFSSLIEQVLSSMFILIGFLVSLAGQASVIVTIIKTESLHNPHFFVIICYCFGDLLMVFLSAPFYISQFIMGCMPLLSGRFITGLGLSTGFGLANLVGLMAFERYMYFCHPMKYGSIITYKSTSLIVIIIFVFSLLFSIITEILIGRIYHASILACNLPDSGVQNIIQVLLFLLPAAVITSFSIFQGG